MGSRQQLSKVQLESVTVQDSEISVRNLGACLMGIHVSKVCSKALRDLYFHQTDPKISIGRCYQSPGSRLCNISS